MSDEVLNIELTGKTDAIPLESFLEVISNTLAILKDIDADLADEATATLDWQIVGASLNSPMLLTIAGLALFGIGDGGEVISAYLKGLDGIEQGITERPAHFTEQAVRKTANLLGVLRGDLKRVKFSSNAETGIQPITPTAKALETVSVIDGFSYLRTTRRRKP